MAGEGSEWSWVYCSATKPTGISLPVYTDALTKGPGDIEPIAHKVPVALFDNVTEMNVDAKVAMAVIGRAGVAAGPSRVALRLRIDPVDDAAKLDRDAGT